MTLLSLRGIETRWWQPYMVGRFRGRAANRQDRPPACVHYVVLLPGL
jgi:hypothetical protein